VGLTVACVLRSGGQYGPEHVAGLQRQVAHYMPAARFACLSDVEVPCERVPLQDNWPGWWSKLELFRHLKGRTLYLDLDTVLVADAEPLVTGQFTMIKNWVLPHLNCSGVMAWDGDFEHITREFETVAERVMRTYNTTERWGDQAFIAEKARHGRRVASFPATAVVSWRYGNFQHRSGPPPGSRIVAFNGVCVPWDGPEWAQLWWHTQAVTA
jgi:hypothetical protein